MVVESEDCRRWIFGQDLLGGAFAVFLREAATDETHFGLEFRGAHRVVVAFAPFCRAGGPVTVDVDDPAMPETDQVLDSQSGAGGIVGADHVGRRRAQRTGHRYDRSARGEFFDVPAGHDRADQDESLTAVVDQRLNRPLLTAGW